LHTPTGLLKKDRHIMAPVFKIAPGVQDYAWGKKGSSSLTAQFGKVSVDGFEIDEDKTYAEVSGAVFSLVDDSRAHPIRECG